MVTMPPTVYYWIDPAPWVVVPGEAKTFAQLQRDICSEFIEKAGSHPPLDPDAYKLRSGGQDVEPGLKVADEMAGGGALELVLK